MHVETAIPARQWLWTTKLSPMSRDVIVHEPIHAARYERDGDGVYMAVVEFEAPEGTIVATTDAATPARFGTCFVVLNDVLQHVHDHEAQDLLDPAGAIDRLHARLCKRAGLDHVSRRIRFPDGHDLREGEFRRWGSWWAVVVSVTARQAWVRAATDKEIIAAGEVLPVARTGADLIAAIRAEVAADQAEAA